VFGWFYLSVLPGWLGLPQVDLNVSAWAIAKSVLIFLGLPLLAYFAIMWAGSCALGKALGLSYQRTTTLAFTAAGNNFELAIAVAIATFGVTSGQALAGVVGPLIEVPVLVALVYVSLALRRRFTTPASPLAEADHARPNP
jgi:ACR3 family arsenite transporter